MGTFQDYLTGDELVHGLHTRLQGLDNDISTQEVWDEVATTVVGNLITGYNESIVPLDYPPGYMAHNSLQPILFYLPGFFDLELATISEVTKQPVAAGELLNW
jgi:hypothetical protein